LSWIFFIRSSTESEGSTLRVFVFPVKVLTKICIGLPQRCWSWRCGDNDDVVDVVDESVEGGGGPFTPSTRATKPTGYLMSL